MIIFIYLVSSLYIMIKSNWIIVMTFHCFIVTKSVLPVFFCLFLNTLMLFWPILSQRKTSLVVFLWIRRTNSVVFLVIIGQLEIILYMHVNGGIVAYMIVKLCWAWSWLTELNKDKVLRLNILFTKWFS